MRLSEFLNAGLKAIAIVVGLAAPAQAQETILHNFGYATGKNPESGPVYDASSRAFYGATSEGGAHRMGVIYKLSRPGHAGGKWRYTVIYDNTLSRTEVTVAGSVVYVSAGENDPRVSCAKKPSASCGVIFSLTPPTSGAGPWTQTVLYSFTAGTDGFDPWGRLAVDSQGALYGTAAHGGHGCARFHGCGTVFKLSPPASQGQAWTYSVLYHFTGGAVDNMAGGNTPLSGVILDKSGNLYGEIEFSVEAAPPYRFLVFKLTPPTAPGEWTETVLHRFFPPTFVTRDGPLAIDADGALYGSFSPCASPSPTDGCSDRVEEYVFQLAPSQADPNAWTFAILHKFLYDSGSPAAPYELTAPLTVDAQGHVYGVTQAGGLNQGGTVFSLRPRPGQPGQWDYQSLVSFKGASLVLVAPNGGLALGPDDLLYGTTQNGGSGNEGSFFSVNK